MSVAPAPGPPHRRWIARSDDVEARVTPLELFFDLVFVFAITQVTAFMAAGLSFAQLGRGMLILALIWWSWSGYAWLTNAVDPDLAISRIVMFCAMGTMLVLAVAVPGAFSDDGVAFALGYLGVRLLHAWLFWLGGPDSARRANVLRLVVTALIAPALILVASLAVDGAARDLVWVAAVVLDYGIVLAAPAEGWHVSPGHFAERFGLIVIIALGESIVSVGAGAAHLPLDLELVAAGALAMATIAALWWAYFDVVAVVAERRFREAPPVAQVLIARDSYALLHLPMIAGIVLFALGLKASTGHLGDALSAPAATALCGGLALYAVAHVAFRLRNVHSWSRQRCVVAAVCVALIPVAAAIPAMASLAILTALWTGLIAYEAVHFAEARRRVREAL